jgi:hypothetical protein
MSVDDLLRERVLTFAAHRLRGFDPTNVRVELHNTLPAHAGALEEIGVLEGVRVFVRKAGYCVTLLGLVHLAGEAISPGKVPDPVAISHHIHDAGQYVCREVADLRNFDQRLASVERVHTELYVAIDPGFPNDQPIMPPATTTTTPGPPPYWGGAAATGLTTGSFSAKITIA